MPFLTMIHLSLISILNKCDALRDLAQLIQSKKREKDPWRNVIFSKSNTLPWVLFTFFRLYKWYQIAQSIANIYEYARIGPELVLRSNSLVNCNPFRP